MAELVKSGQPIPLRLQLSDEDQSAFPQANLLDETGVDLPSSPVDLSSTNRGLYLNSAITMPGNDRIFAQYKVFSDAAHTIPHPIHNDTLLDVFERDINGEKIDNINNSIAASQGSFDQLTGFIDDSEMLFGSVIDSENLTGIIEDNDGLIGIIEQATLIGVLNAGETLVGKIEC